MNAREGVRRLGILLGLCGMLLGGVAAYGDAREVWDSYVATRRFESLLASTTIRKVSKAVREYQNAPPVKNPSFDERSGKIDDLMEAKHRAEPDVKGLLADPRFQQLDLATQKSTLGQLDSRFANLSDDEFQTFKERLSPPPGYTLDAPDRRGGILVSVNLGGIKDVMAGKDGIFQIDLSTGEAVRRTEPPHLIAYLRLLLYPLLGFLLPWGAVRGLTWVGSGFFTPKG